MNMRQHDNQAYSVDCKIIDGKHVVWFHVKCGVPFCSNSESIHLSPTFSSAAVYQKFRNRDWSLVPGKPKRNRCPTCERRPAKAAVAAVHPPKESPMKDPVKPASLTYPATRPLLTAVPTPSMAEARKIFALVEGHFDEAKGCYTGEYSDERVATELNLPRAMITKAREDSGLKIKGDPEMLALMGEIASVKELLVDLEQRVRKFEFKKAS